MNTKQTNESITVMGVVPKEVNHCPTCGAKEVEINEDNTVIQCSGCDKGFYILEIEG